MPIHSSIRQCIHIKVDGQACGSPAVSNRPRCFHHEEVVRRRNLRKVPFLKNAADLQLAVMDTIRGLLERRLTHREATTVLYALQLAQANLKTSGFNSGIETVHQSKGSLVHHLLEDADEASGLDVEAEVALYIADKKDFADQLAIGKAYRESQKRTG